MQIDPNFQAYLENQDFSAITVRGYLADLGHFADWFFKTNGEILSPTLVTPTDVKGYRQYLLVDERYKANTINRRLSAISAYIKWARDTEQIFNDPAENVKCVKRTPEAPKWLDKNEQYALQRAIEKDVQISKLRYPKRWMTRRRDASLVLFLLHTGLRLTELLSLQLEDVHLSERKGNILIQNGKGGKQRSLPLNSDARKALQDWLAIRPKKIKSTLVWVAVEGETTGLSGRAVQRVLQRYAQQSGLEELSPHICRHTFAKNLINQGVGLEKVAMLLGHANLNTTRIYITPDERDLEHAVGTLSQ